MKGLSKVKLTYLKKTLLVFVGCCLVVIALSTIGLIWSNYYILVSTAIGSVGAGFNLFLLLKSTEALNPEAEKKSSMFFFLGGNAIRTLIMLASIGLSALVIYLTDGTKYEYLSIVAAGVPFLSIALVTILVKDNDITEKSN